MLTADQREQVATELKRFAADLKLSDEQKEKLQAALGEARERSQSTSRAIPARPEPTSLPK
jgi:septal ring factor EnvC (AmiA/AmiB activator)